LAKLKAAHNPKVKVEAQKVNEDLRRFVEDQRKDCEFAIRIQMKKNREYEKQKGELAQEEAMLTQYLEIVKKRLASQMLKLPTIAQLQHRGKEEKEVKRTKKRHIPVKEGDDSEMKAIKRTVAQFLDGQKRAQTAFK
jgi:hypothetical protein